jgi:glutaryl-CoA dehydrogenase
VLRLTRAEVAWAAVGNSIGAYDAAVKYAGERIQFGKEIGGPPAGAGAARQEPRQHHLLDYDVIRYFSDAEAIYSYEGTREMNTLIVGRAITGKAAFV